MRGALTLILLLQIALPILTPLCQLMTMKRSLNSPWYVVLLFFFTFQAHLVFGITVAFVVVALVVSGIVVRRLSASNLEIRNALLQFLPERFLPEFKGTVMDSIGIYAGLNASGIAPSYLH